MENFIFCAVLIWEVDISKKKGLSKFLDNF